jgi:GAF domain-containing protein
MSHSIIKRLTSIGIALSAEKDIDTLLNMILDEAKDMTRADAGTLYVVDNDSQTLVFSIMHNDTNNIHARHKEDIDLAPVPLYLPDTTPNHANVSSHAALTGENVNIEDVYAARKFDFSGPKKYDRITGYRSRSMLVIPMKDHHGDILGVVQLINATDPETGKVCKFTEEQAEMVASLASQAAVSLNNARLIQNLEDLLQAFIKTIASAIDAKSKYTGNHIRRVVQLTMDIAEAVNQCDSPPFDTIHFDDDQIQELSLASWLHDVGKIITPQHIIDKHAKLETVIDRAELVRTRFQLIESSLRLANAQAKIDGLTRGEIRPVHAGSGQTARRKARGTPRRTRAHPLLQPLPGVHAAGPARADQGHRQQDLYLARPGIPLSERRRNGQSLHPEGQSLGE